MSWLNFITGVETEKPAAMITSGQLQWKGNGNTSLGRVIVTPDDWIFSLPGGAFLSKEFEAQHVDPRTIPDIGVQKILSLMKTLLEKSYKDPRTVFSPIFVRAVFLADIFRFFTDIVLVSEFAGCRRFRPI